MIALLIRAQLLKRLLQNNIAKSLPHPLRWSSAVGTGYHISFEESNASGPRCGLEVKILPFVPGSIRIKSRKELENDAFRSSSIYSPIGRIFGHRGDAWRPRTRLADLASNSKKSSCSTGDDHVGEGYS